MLNLLSLLNLREEYKEILSQLDETHHYNEDATERMEETVRILDLAVNVITAAKSLTDGRIDDDEYTIRFDDAVEEFLDREDELI